MNGVLASSCSQSQCHSSKYSNPSDGKNAEIRSVVVRSRQYKSFFIKNKVVVIDDRKMSSRKKIPNRDQKSTNGARSDC